MEEIYVFISYSRHDRDFVQKLADDLHKAGVQTWIDINNIQPGENWQKAIENGLQKAEILLHISSKNSIESDWMIFELKSAINKEANIIPIIIDDIGAQNLPSALREFQWVDFRRDYQTAFQRLISALPKLVQRESPIQKQKSTTKGYVFLSYAEEDFTFVDKLKDFLSKRNFAYWDYRESSRDYHQQLFLELENVINESEATLSILSPSWKQSLWAQREYFYSDEAGIPVFLLKAKELGPTLAVAGMPYIDFTQSEQDGFDRLSRELIRKGL